MSYCIIFNISRNIINNKDELFEVYVLNKKLKDIPYKVK